MSRRVDLHGTLLLFRVPESGKREGLFFAGIPRFLQAVLLSYHPHLFKMRSIITSACHRTGSQICLPQPSVSLTRSPAMHAGAAVVFSLKKRRKYKTG